MSSRRHVLSEQNKTPIVDFNKPRNVVDHFKWLTDEEIKSELEPKRLNFSVLLVNTEMDNNLGNIVRSFSTFLGRKIYLYGRKAWDKRAAVGSYVFQDIQPILFEEDLQPILDQYDEIISFDYIDLYSANVRDFVFDKNKNYLFIFGQESSGIPQLLLNKSDKVLHINMRGSTRSLNVSVAAGIVLYEYTSQVTKES